jgi:NAD+ synthase (glutamine-hydrolysing)
MSILVRENIIGLTKQWFKDRDLNTAIVGFSGGIDSAVTAAILSEAGIRVILVCANAPNQTYSSKAGNNTREFCEIFRNATPKTVNFQFPFGTVLSDGRLNCDMTEGAMNEAALPIIRNAIFYGVAAEYRCYGLKPVVVGTANFDEAAYLGFWGKASDAAQDLYLISHLHKSEVYQMARELGVPQSIIEAVPSGDLLFSGEVNDYTMIGANYDQIELIARLAYEPTIPEIMKIGETIGKLGDPQLFMDNIFRNRFKYELPFGGFHLNKKLEDFRQRYYDSIIMGCRVYVTSQQKL